VEILDATSHVAIVKMGSYHERGGPAIDGGEVLDQIENSLAASRLCGIVAEGLVPYGVVNPSTDAVLRGVAHRGIPVVMVARGSLGGPVVPRDSFIAGGYLTAMKARLLVMATLLRYGSLPRSAKLSAPIAEEWCLSRALAGYQVIFDSH
jgi:hypothetical protein